MPGGIRIARRARDHQGLRQRGAGQPGRITRWNRHRDRRRRLRRAGPAGHRQCGGPRGGGGRRGRDRGRCRSRIHSVSNRLLPAAGNGTVRTSPARPRAVPCPRHRVPASRRHPENSGLADLQAAAQLAAVAAIRTALNYFLSKEIREQQELVAAARAHGPDSSKDATHPAATHADARGGGRAIRSALAPWACWRDPR